MEQYKAYIIMYITYQTVFFSFCNIYSALVNVSFSKHAVASFFSTNTTKQIQFQFLFQTKFLCGPLKFCLRWFLFTFGICFQTTLVSFRFFGDIVDRISYRVNITLKRILSINLLCPMYYLFYFVLFFCKSQTEWKTNWKYVFHEVVETKR